MKRILFTIACIYFVNTVHAQETAAKNVFVEIGGPGIASINYDMRLTPKRDGLGFRVGIGGFSIDGAGLITVPLGLNYIMSKDDRNYFELGAGFTYLNFKDNIVSDNKNFSSSFGSVSIGYRLQPANGGFLFKAELTPIFGQGYFLPFYGGISFGYSF